MHVASRQDGAAALPHRHVPVEIAVARRHRAVDVAREVRERVGRALADRPTVAMAVTAVRQTGARLTRAAEPTPPTNSTSQLPAAQADPGATGLTGALGGGRSGHVESRQDGAAALPHPHVPVEIAVARRHRAVDVAREVRERVGRALADRPAVAVVITAVRLTGTRLTRAAEPAPPTNSTSQLPAAQAVPPVTGLTGALGGGRSGHVEWRQDGAALPHWLARVESGAPSPQPTGPGGGWAGPSPTGRRWPW
ncbi:hypothetical protein ACWEGS_09470 [Streptomyces sp. NPDC004822]